MYTLKDWAKSDFAQCGFPALWYMGGMFVVGIPVLVCDMLKIKFQLLERIFNFWMGFPLVSFIVLGTLYILANRLFGYGEDDNEDK